MNKRLPLLLSLLGVILLAASLAYWILQLYQPPQRPIAAVPHTSLPDPSIDAAATLFGGQVATASAANYQLTGIVSAGRESVAIIVAEGSPPKALVVGKELVPGITLAEVHARYVMLSDGGVMKRLDLAADTKPAAAMGGAAVPPGAAAAAMPATLAPGATVPEPPMSPGPVPQQQPQNQEFASPGDVGQHDAPPPANPNSAPANLNNPNANNQAPTPVQMPPPTRPAGSPVSGASPNTQ
ncbi:type II secretion system protein N [Massilia aerilata]|uniref:Type II secretion system protein N n=1 Tax=Massilia aerilata TaxID=453817 RepID=A0ABW0RXF2_9BURK